MKNKNVDDTSWVRRWIKKGLSKDKKTLDLSNRRFDLQIAMDIAENMAVPGIEILYMHTCWIKDSYLEELAAADLLKPIKELWLFENKIGCEGARYLAESFKFPNLRYLSLYSNKIGPDGVEALAQSPHFSHLETLALSFNRVGDHGAVALAHSKNLPRLHTLHLDGNGIGREGMEALAATPGLKNLKVLNLRYNQIAPQGFEALRESHRLNSLAEFRFDCPDDD